MFCDPKKMFELRILSDFTGIINYMLLITGFGKFKKKKFYNIMEKKSFKAAGMTPWKFKET